MIDNIWISIIGYRVIFISSQKILINLLSYIFDSIDKNFKVTLNLMLLLIFSKLFKL
jgi:hypothetical protein